MTEGIDIDIESLIEDDDQGGRFDLCTFLGPPMELGVLCVSSFDLLKLDLQ